MKRHVFLQASFKVLKRAGQLNSGENYAARDLLVQAKASVVLSRAILRQAITTQSFFAPLRKNFAEATHLMRLRVLDFWKWAAYLWLSEVFKRWHRMLKAELAGIFQTPVEKNPEKQQ